MFTIACCLVVPLGIRVRIRFIAGLVSCYAQVFVLLPIVVVTLLHGTVYQAFVTDFSVCIVLVH